MPMAIKKEKKRKKMKNHSDIELSKKISTFPHVYKYKSSYF